MEYDVIKTIKNKISKRTWLCILSGLVTGWLTHFYMLTNKLPNWDDLTNAGGAGAGRDFGRWVLGYVHPFAGRDSIPALHGVMYIICLTLAACIVLEILQLKSDMAAILVPAVMVTFPSVAGVMTFMFTAHNYGLAVLMLCLGVYCLRKYRYGWAAGIVLFVAALGIYQSYISIAIALMLMGMVCDLIRGDSFKQTLIAGIKCVVVLLVTVAIYMVMCRVMWPDIANQSYAGIGNMGQIPIAEMPILIARCYKRFLEYFIWKPFAFVSTTAQVLNILVCLMLGGAFVYLLWVKKLYTDILRMLLTGLLLFFLPLAVAFVYFMAPDAPYSMLMLYAYCLIYVMVLALAELCMEHWRTENKAATTKVYAKQIAMLIVVVVIGLSCYTDYLVSNEAYFRMDIAMKRTESYFNRIVAAVESQDGFEYGDKVVFIGEFHYENNPSPIDDVDGDRIELEYLRELSGVAFENGLITSGIRNSFIRIYLGFEMYDITEDEKQQITGTILYQEMPNYPAEGSIQKIDDIWVVKLCE